MDRQRKTKAENEATQEWLDTDTAPDSSTTSAEAGRRRPEPTPSETAVRRVGRFDLIERLGRGGMGEVWRAVHVMLHKPVALKLIAADRMTDPEAVARFRREIRLVSGLNHPNIVRFENAGEADGEHYLAMELVRGISFEQLVRQVGALPVADACQLIGQAAVGLEQAACEGLVHRDIKPSNLMLSDSGTAKILDFGLARLAEAAGEELTASGRTLGTVEYLAPEQALASHDADVRADIYSLGCTLYRLLAGRPPFPADAGGDVQLTAPQLVQRHANEPPPPLRDVRDDVPPQLEEIVARMLAKRPEQRHQTPAEVAADLAPLAEDCDIRALLQRADLEPAVDESPGSSSGSSSFSTSTADYLSSAAQLSTGEPHATEDPHQADAPTAARRSPPRWLLATATLLALVLLAATAASRLFRKPSGAPQTERDNQVALPSEENLGPVTVIDWDEHDWPDTKVYLKVFPLEDVEVKVSFEGDLDFVPGPSSPNDHPKLMGGLKAMEETLLLETRWAGAGRRLTLVIDFSSPVREVSFSLFDVDHNPGGRPERVRIEGSLGGEAVRPVHPQLTTGPANKLDSAGAVTGASPADDVGQQSGAGNVSVRFPRSVEQIRVTLESAPGEGQTSQTGEAEETGDATAAAIALHDLQFEIDKPFATSQTLDWDQVDWNRVRQHTINAGDVNVAVALSGDFLLGSTQRSWMDDVPREQAFPMADVKSGPIAAQAEQAQSINDTATERQPFASQDGGGDIARAGNVLLWQAQLQGGHESVAAALDFSAAVSHVEFDILGVDAEPGPAAEQVAVYGSLQGQRVEPRIEPGDLSVIHPKAQAAPHFAWSVIVPRSATGPDSGRPAAAAARVRFDEPVDRVFINLSGRFPEQDGEPAAPPQDATLQIALGDIHFRTLKQQPLPIERAEILAVVPATANPWLLNRPWQVRVDGDSSPNEMPVVVQNMMLKAGGALTFSARGGVRERPGLVLRDADGGREVSRDASGTGISAPAGGLVGVFLGDETRATGGNGGSALADHTIAPPVGEWFLIGDGSTDDGRPQQFVVPAGAGRLALAVMDLSRWRDNVGAFDVQIRAAAPRQALLRLSADDVDVDAVVDSQAPITLAAGSSTTVAVEPGAHRVEFRRSGTQVYTLQERLRCEGHTDRVRCVAFSTDGSQALSIGREGSLRWWNVETGEMARQFGRADLPETHAAAISDDAALAATAHAGGTICIWDCQSGRLKHQIENSTGVMRNSIRFTSDGRIMSARTDQSVQFWDARSGQSAGGIDLQRRGDNLSCAVLTPDGQRLLAGYNSGTLALHDARTGALIAHLSGPRQQVLDVDCSSDRAAAAFKSARVIVFDLNDFTQVQQMAEGTQVEYVSFYDSGRLLATGGFDKRLSIWDVATGVEVAGVTTDTQVAHRFDVSPDGHLVLTAGGWRWTSNGQRSDGDFAVRLWQLPAGGPQTLPQAAQLKTQLLSSTASAPLGAPGSVAEEVVRQLVVGPGDELEVSAAPDVMNLLELVAPQRDAVQGEARWQEAQAALRLEAAESQQVLLQLPVVTPAEFDLELQVERIGGNGPLGIGFSAATGRGLALFDVPTSEGGASGGGFVDRVLNFIAGPPPTSGLRQVVDEKPVLSAPMRRHALPKGQLVTLRMAVRRDGVQVLRDGQPWLHWTGDTSQLSMHADDESRCAGCLFVRSDQSRFVIRRFALASLSGPPRRIELSDATATSPDRLAAERVLWKGGFVTLDSGGWESRVISQLEDLPRSLHLRSVDSSDSQRMDWNDDDMQLIAGLSHLQKLDLAGSRVTDKGVQHLQDLPHLSFLSLSGTAVSNSATRHLAGLKSLQALFLAGTQVSDAGLANLRQLSQLQRLGLSYTQIGDEGLAAMKPALQNVTWLCVCNTQVTFQSLPLLSELEQLETLHLAGVKMGDDDLPQLFTLKNLREIRLIGTQVTQQGKDELKRQLPQVKLIEN